MLFNCFRFLCLRFLYGDFSDYIISICFSLHYYIVTQSFLFNSIFRFFYVTCLQFDILTIFNSAFVIKINR
uniref:Uncharacterized protein n=1 Tax=Pararge aegeria TaxID=116150 RepID=S4NRA8_9NEOP